MGKKKKHKSQESLMPTFSSISLDSMANSSSIPSSIQGMGTPPPTPIPIPKTVVMVMPQVFDELKQQVQGLDNRLQQAERQIDGLKNQLAEKEKQLKQLDTTLQTNDARVKGLDNFVGFMSGDVAMLYTLALCASVSRSNVNGLTKCLGYVISGATGFLIYDDMNSNRTQQKSMIANMYQSLFNKPAQNQESSDKPSQSHTI